jgi:hypothetical protein
MLSTAVQDKTKGCYKNKHCLVSLSQLYGTHLSGSEMEINVLSLNKA